VSGVRQDLVVSMVLLGINRIVVTDGAINAKVVVARIAPPSRSARASTPFVRMYGRGAKAC
jgi:hypothetical protein